MRGKGISLYLHGDPGTGKTGIGVLILKEARAWGYTALFASVADLREAVRHRDYSRESTITDKARTVDFLLLDDLCEADINEKTFNMHEVRNLLISRWDKGLVTILTSTLIPGQWREKKAEDVANGIHKTCVSLRVTGPNRHSEQATIKSSILAPAIEDKSKSSILDPK